MVDPSPGFEAEPFQVEYKRWKHVTSGQVYIVTGVQHNLGNHGWYTTVEIKHSETGKRSSVAVAYFKKHYVSLGRKLKFPSCWERIDR